MRPDTAETNSKLGSEGSKCNPVHVGSKPGGTGSI